MANEASSELKKKYDSNFDHTPRDCHLIYSHRSIVINLNRIHHSCVLLGIDGDQIPEIESFMYDCECNV